MDQHFALKNLPGGARIVNHFLSLIEVGNLDSLLCCSQSLGFRASVGQQVSLEANPAYSSVFSCSTKRRLFSTLSNLAQFHSKHEMDGRKRLIKRHRCAV